MIGRTNAGGGSGGTGGGATLVISSPANVSVTVSKDNKSYTKNSGPLGSATFKGLATGTWTVVMSSDGQTATRTIEITADYAITIALFSATINITYPANSTCVVADSGGQTVASDTNATSSVKTFTATVNAIGTYTVTATATDGSGNSKSQNVSITADGQSESVKLNYDLMLFDGDNGGDVTSLTGGWVSRNSDGGRSEITDKYIKFKKTSDTHFVGSIYTKNTFSFDGQYSKLNVSFTVTAQDASCGVTSNNTERLNPSYIASTSASVGVVSVDISNVSGNYYICIYSGNNGFTVNKVWLE